MKFSTVYSLVPVLLPETEAEEDFLFDGPNAITIDEATKMLKGSRGTVDNLRKNNKLKSHYKCRSVRLDHRQVLEATKW
ncbi:hypothetical protein SAMN05216436_1316 [bacterium A37T11]|nr:hypothetical protein SAMN05216436_1316 [bacterium A37T11]